MVMKMLEKIKSLSVNLKEIEVPETNTEIYKDRNDAKFILKNSNTLNPKTKDIVELFLSLTCKGYDDIYITEMISEFAIYSKNSLFKFIIFEINSDYIFVPLKFTNIFKHTYYSICYKVISLYNNQENIKTVIKFIQDNLKIIRYCYKRVGYVTELDNHYNTREDLEYFSSKKYRSKHYIPFLENLIQVDPNFRDGAKVEELYKIWAESKPDASYRKGMDSKLVRDSNNQDLFSLGMFVNGKLVSYSTYVVRGDLAFSLTSKTLCSCSPEFLSEYLGIELSQAKILKRLNRFRMLKTLEKLFRDFESVRCLYVLDAGSDKRLMQSKMEVCKHSVFYEKAPVQETPFEPNIREFKDTPNTLEW